MTNLTQMLKQLNDGDVVAQLSREFGINPAEAEAAISALAPAFSAGLKRNTEQPQDFGRFLEAISDGHHEHYADNPSDAMRGDGRREGKAILGHLFKSKDVSRAVAANAAQQTGLSTDLLKKLLPALAPIILGGLFKQMGRSGNSGNNPLGDILGQLAGSRGGGSNPIGDILEQMMGGGRKPSQPAPSDNPLGQIFEEMLGGGQPGNSRRAPDRPGGGLGDLFGELFESGQSRDDRRVQEMESIFDEFLGGRRS